MFDATLAIGAREQFQHVRRSRDGVWDAPTIVSTPGNPTNRATFPIES